MSCGCTWCMDPAGPERDRPDVRRLCEPQSFTRPGRRVDAMRQPPERGVAALPFAARYALYSSCVSCPSALASASVNAFARLCTAAASVTLSVPFLSVSRSDQFFFCGSAEEDGVAAVDLSLSFDQASFDCAASPCVPVGCSVVLVDCVVVDCVCVVGAVVCGAACESVDCGVADCGYELCAKASGAASVSARARKRGLRMIMSSVSVGDVAHRWICFDATMPTMQRGV